MRAAYLAVAGRIRQELYQVTERVLMIWQQASSSTNDYYIDAVALNLHSFYAGVEHLLEIIAEGVDQIKPSGANWHRELLQQMTAEIPGVRPSVISFELRDRLDRYRGFRHVVRNVYTFNLDSQQIEVLVRQLQPTIKQITQE